MFQGIHVGTYTIGIALHMFIGPIPINRCAYMYTLIHLFYISGISLILHWYICGTSLVCLWYISDTSLVRLLYICGTALQLHYKYYTTTARLSLLEMKSTDDYVLILQV